MMRVEAIKQETATIMTVSKAFASIIRGGSVGKTLIKFAAACLVAVFFVQRKLQDETTR